MSHLLPIFSELSKQRLPISNTESLHPPKVLMPMHPEVNQQLGIPLGNLIRVTYQKPYYRCGWGSWSPQQLNREISDGYWKIVASNEITSEMVILNQLPPDE